jgi:hypothetical protein
LSPHNAGAASAGVFQNEQQVMDMNAVWHSVSPPVQCGTISVASTIDVTDQSDGHFKII